MGFADLELLRQGLRLEPQLQACSGNDIVVWANINSKIYHFSGHRDYGHAPARITGRTERQDAAVGEPDPHGAAVRQYDCGCPMHVVERQVG
jgi:hypothetical protein